MNGRAVVHMFGLMLVLAAAATTRGSAAAVVGLTLHGGYFPEPATVQLTISVEPNDANRTLLIEADGEGMYAASEISLNGANEKRLHQVVFKRLIAGQYSLRAAVRSSTGVRGVVSREIEVLGLGSH